MTARDGHTIAPILGKANLISKPGSDHECWVRWQLEFLWLG
jgi:hypothetical protein